MIVKIVVEGGVVTEVYTERQCDVEVIDVDNLREDGLSSSEIPTIIDDAVVNLIPQDID